MTTNLRILLACLICIFIVLFGTIGYVVIDDFPWFDALYMTIITVTTVGFGETHSLSVLGRAFTILLILIGFSSLAFVGHSLVESLLEKISSKSKETLKMQKKISRLSSHYIICGYGRVGRSAADHFAAVGAKFVIIEPNIDHCQQIKEKGFLFIEGDATKEEDLLAAGIKNAAGLLALLNTDPDNLFIVLSARELNPTLRIVSRSVDPSSGHKILQAGADNVISPFKTAGQQIADDILISTGQSSVATTSSTIGDASPQWIEVKAGSSMQGKPLDSLYQEMRRTIIGIRRNGTDTIYPDLQTIVDAGDKILVIDYSTSDSSYIDTIKTVPQKILIVDDNPVIVRLYTRLFQKAGFHPFSAVDGKEGLDFILTERPVAAVIDYQLPLLTGIEVCTKVRAAGLTSDAIKLILFTTDSETDTREKALSAGADEVIIKSSNAAELVDNVARRLKSIKA